MPELVFHRYTEPEKVELGRQLLRRQVKRIGPLMFDSADFYGGSDADTSEGTDDDSDEAVSAQARQ